MPLTLAPIEIIATEATAIVSDDDPVRIQHRLYCVGVSIISIRSFFFRPERWLPPIMTRLDSAWAVLCRC